MDLSDALGDGWLAGGNNQSGGAGGWPGQPSNPTWPGGQPANPTWPGGQPTNPTWPGGQPANPTWPGGQPANPTWPGGQPGVQPTWPAQPSQPSQPGHPGQPSAPGWPSPSTGPQTAPQQSLTIPFNQSLPNGVYDKLLITIGGTIKPNAKKITMDICKAGDIAFHFNPRFDEDHKKVIVCNSCIGNKWGREERSSNFPFVPGQPFEMMVLCTNRGFKVAVNNSHLLEFHHRITDLRSINSIKMYYDLSLSRVTMETLP
ncbi:galectin-3-like [Acanthopagrus latus]|uniref:galectin-3-like n=1 Tax=Acanthopagrus latus TaxID=8177 RepID=UPI00187C3D74|nr:galectin-3-like [Acanthopagrus latus]